MTAQLTTSGVKEEKCMYVCNQYSPINMCFLVYLHLKSKKCEDKIYSTENTLGYIYTLIHFLQLKRHRML